jgi:hypothetical protein
MAQPPRSRLRAARRSGLTSPDQVRTPMPPGNQPSGPDPRPPDKPHHRERQENHALKALTDENRSHEISRWIEAKR